MPDDNEFQFIANGIVSHHNLKTDGQRTMIVDGYECVKNCKKLAKDSYEAERKWSNPESWSTGKVP